LFNSTTQDGASWAYYPPHRGMFSGVNQLPVLEALLGLFLCAEVATIKAAAILTHQPSYMIVQFVFPHDPNQIKI